MELINVTGYLAEEKMEIAKRYLVPKQLEEHGIGKKELRIDKAALERIIESIPASPESAALRSRSPR